MVGKPERHAADDGRAAVWPHHEHIAPGGFLFDGDLLRQRHVVAEHKHMEAALHSLERLGGGVDSRH